MTGFLTHCADAEARKGASAKDCPDTVVVAFSLVPGGPGVTPGMLIGAIRCYDRFPSAAPCCATSRTNR